MILTPGLQRSWLARSLSALNDNLYMILRWPLVPLSLVQAWPVHSVFPPRTDNSIWFLQEFDLFRRQVVRSLRPSALDFDVCEAKRLCVYVSTHVIYTVSSLYSHADWVRILCPELQRASCLLFWCEQIEKYALKASFFTPFPFHSSLSPFCLMFSHGISFREYTQVSERVQGMINTASQPLSRIIL